MFILTYSTSLDDFPIGLFPSRGHAVLFAGEVDKKDPASHPRIASVIKASGRGPSDPHSIQLWTCDPDTRETLVRF